MIINRTQVGSMKTRTPTAPVVTVPTTVASKTFTQVTPSTTWVISHNLGRRPFIKTYTANGVVEIHGEVTHPSDNVSNVLFDIPVPGIAIYF